MEKVARTLPLNETAELQGLCETLDGVLARIVEAEDAEQRAKFSVLRTANKLVQQRILARPGGREFLLAVGFVLERNEEGETCYVLPEQEQVEQGRQELQEARAWLVREAETAALLRDGNPPQMSVLIFRMGHNQMVLRAAFVNQEKVEAAYNFVRLYLQPHMHDAFVLRTSYPARDLGADNLALTLQEAGLAPKATIAVAMTGEGGGEWAPENAFRGAESQSEIARRAAQQRQHEQRLKQKAEKEYREKLVSQFQEDRSEMRDRGWGVAPAAASAPSSTAAAPSTSSEPPSSSEEASSAETPSSSAAS